MRVATLELGTGHRYRHEAMIAPYAFLKPRVRAVDGCEESVRQAQRRLRNNH